MRDLALSGAFDSLCPNRRQLLWEFASIGEDGGTDLRLDLHSSSAPANIPDFTPSEKWWHELDVLGIALKAHPMQFMREKLRSQGVLTCADARNAPTGKQVRAGGMIIRPHRPPTKSGRTVVFFTLEDETELLEVTVFESVYNRCGKAIFTQPIRVVTGNIDRRGAPGTAGSLMATHVEGVERQRTDGERGGERQTPTSLPGG